METSANTCLPVRVWLGYALPSLRQPPSRNQFYQQLGSIFMPATVQLMQPWGLTSYLPTALPFDNNPITPDEVALVFYRSVEDYHQASNASVGGRGYQLLHKTLFNFESSDHCYPSHSGFPTPYRGSLATAGYYYWPDSECDWQAGETTVMVGVYEGTDTNAFRRELNASLTSLCQQPPAGLDGAIVAIADSVVVLWCHWLDATRAIHPLDGLGGVRLVWLSQARRVSIPLNVTEPFSGLPVQQGDSLNFHFTPVQY